ncbi:MAG: SMP-30/gluconolactonase/LRE family protein, partial [Oscillospiraceae bacterium]|nr:SMP-30/gluconolactonase/LRE family protein [Oscillospiraceae bacterium]
MNKTWPEIDMNPLPPDAAGLPTVEAEPWFCIDPDPGMCIEGPAADEQGNLYVCVAVPFGPPPKIVKITPTRVMTDFYLSDGSDLPTGIAIHKDGRLFVAAMFGGFTVLNPDGTVERRIIPRYDDGTVANPNDCVFDEKGNLYFSDYKGHIGCPDGAVARLDAEGDYTHVTKILGNMMMPNG